MHNKHKNTTQDSKARSWLKKICKSLILFSPCAFKVRKCILEKIGPLQYQSEFQTSSIKKIVYNISMLASVYKYTKKEWYIDEGIIHRIINLCVSYGIPKEIMYEIIVSLKDVMKEVTPYFLDTSVDICYESILDRGRPVSYTHLAVYKRPDMWYVIQTITGKEEELARAVSAYLSPALCEACFTVKRRFCLLYTSRCV